jgi:hypothetical protein
MSTLAYLTLLEFQRGARDAHTQILIAARHHRPWSLEARCSGRAVTAFRGLAVTPRAAASPQRAQRQRRTEAVLAGVQRVCFCTARPERSPSTLARLVRGAGRRGQARPGQ